MNIKSVTYLNVPHKPRAFFSHPLSTSTTFLRHKPEGLAEHSPRSRFVFGAADLDVEEWGDMRGVEIQLREGLIMRRDEGTEV